MSTSPAIITETKYQAIASRAISRSTLPTSMQAGTARTLNMVNPFAFPTPGFNPNAPIPADNKPSIAFPVEARRVIDEQLSDAGETLAGEKTSPFPWWILVLGALIGMALK